MEINITKGQEVDIPWGSDLQIGLTWDVEEGKFVDLDASAVVFDNFGVLLDAAYFNQQQTIDKSILHSGDNKSGLGEGEDERITIISSLIHPAVRAIAIVVNAYRGGDFSIVNSATATVRDITFNVDVVKVSLPACSSEESGLILAVLYRNDFGQWKIRNTYETAIGKNFKESEISIRKVLKEIIPSFNLIRDFDYVGQGHFNLEKDQVFVIPKVDKLIFGLNWELQSAIDLDASLVAFDILGRVLEDHTLFFGRKSNSNKSLEHSGDNVSGKEKVDQETIKVDLPNLPKYITSLVLTVNIFTADKTFEEVNNAYVRMIEEGLTNREICRFSLQNCGKSSAILLSRLFFDGVDWKLEAIGSPMTGRSWRALLPDIQADYLKLSPPSPHLATISVDLTIIAGDNFPAMDSDGASDPYIIIHFEEASKPMKTSCKKNTLHPIWEDRYCLIGKKENIKTIKLEVFDKDLISDDPMGYIELNIEEFPFDRDVEIHEKLLPFPDMKKSLAKRLKSSGATLRVSVKRNSS